MCGRYSLVCIDDLGNRFRVHNPMIGARSHFNISPGNEMPVIVRKETDEIAMMRWGLVPHGTTDPASAPKPINARAETLPERSLFGPLVQSGRCLVPATGFFEWKKEGKRRIPFYFTVPESPLIAFAGLFDSWKHPGGGTLLSYTIITCAPNELVAEVHDRMPVILTRENEVRWLSHDPLMPLDLPRLLSPFPASAMVKHPVSTHVNSPAVDDERVIRPLFGLT